MKTSSDTPTTNEVRLTLESLESLKRRTIQSARPPIWLNALMTLALAVSLWLTLYHHIVGHHLPLILMGAFVCLLIFWVRRCRKLGLSPKLLPTNLAGFIFQIVQVAFFISVFSAAKYLYEDGLLWAGYVGITLISIIFSYLFHNYPTNEWTSEGGDQ